MELAQITLLTAAAFGFALPGLAQQADIVVTGTTMRMGYEQASAEVPFGDINLKQDTGVKTLRSRVRAEAKKMCGARDSSTATPNTWQQCYNSVLASAEPLIDRVVRQARGN